MKNKRTWKSVVASILVTVALAAPITIISSADDPYDAELIFEIAGKGSMVFHGDDASVQLFINVAVDGAKNSTGASFNMTYNPDYLTPSYAQDTTDDKGVFHPANEPLTDQGAQELDVFFREDKNLFGLTDSNGNQIKVFQEYVLPANAYPWESGEYYSHVDVGQSTIDMDLWFNDQKIHNALEDAGLSGGAGKLARMCRVTLEGNDLVYVINKQDEEDYAPNQTVDKVVLGQLSFRVNKEHLAEMIALFGVSPFTDDGFVCAYDDPVNLPARPEVSLGSGKTKLIDIQYDTQDAWQVGFYSGRAMGRQVMYYSPLRGVDTSKNIADRYIYNFDRDLIVDVQLTNPDFEINAYQNYTAGTPGDLPISMNRWAGMVTVTYADGRKENQPFPWNRAASVDNKYKAKYVTTYDGTKAWKDMAAADVTPANYDPTAYDANYLDGVGTDYIFSQLYQTYQTDSDGNYLKNAAGDYVVDYTFPIPVVGHMRVIPIKVLDVTAQDMTRTYLVSSVTREVKNTGDLKLPSQARIITDIVPGNVSLVTPIKGWKPTEPGSTWPTTSMHTLKARGHNAGTGLPQWPDDGDNLALKDNYIGDYYFETSDAARTIHQGILRTDIQASFPWLTVPEEQYFLDEALRRIVGNDRFADPNDYVVEYVSTVTDDILDGTGQSQYTKQPTLTLSVSKAEDAPKRSMADASVFRVWLPNGLELGTGLTDSGLAKNIDDWFADIDSRGEAHGDYHTDGNHSTSQGYKYFHLITNPADPALPASATSGDEYFNGNRETLRRYINLGGWYFVAICENPDGAEPLWTDPIPVYVPPRPNEYQESKLYNFVAENQGLYNWPGGIGTTLAFPRGEYDTVAPDLHDGNYDPTTANYSYIGLPMYEIVGGSGETIVTHGGTTPSIYVDGNPYRIQENVSRHSESYGVMTTYDGQTGAQPGMIYTVRVDDTDNGVNDQDWHPYDDQKAVRERLSSLLDPAQDTVIYRHGETALQNDYRVTGFGTVYQPDGKANGYPTTPETATLRHQLAEPASQGELEKITLTSEVDEGITRVVQGDKKSNVTLVTFNTVQEGYTVRQDHLLYINNVGDVDIYGLDIDTLIDGYPLNDFDPGQGGHFEITMAPASFLPAGCSTPFILTYVYDLRTNPAGEMHYRDTLYITSTSHPTPKHGGTNQNNPGPDGNFDYLLDFDAELTVSRDPLHKVTVIYRPTDGTMGTAGLIVGEESGVMNTATTTNTYPQGDRVYVEVQKLDEYEVKAVTSDGTDVTPLNYERQGGTATLADGTEVWYFTMPNRDVTIYVDFWEPILSKLRLDDLIDFSTPKTDEPADLDLVKGYDPTGVYEPNDKADHIYKVWKKQFSDQDYTDAAAWKAGDGKGYDEDYYLMTAGSAIPATQNGNVYDSSNAHYLVVIENEDDFSQIKATLRNVKFHVDWRGPLKGPDDPDYDPQVGYNNDIKPTVNMVVYYANQVREQWTTVSDKIVYNSEHGYGPYDPNPPHANRRPNGDTALNTQHITGTYYSTAFPSYASFESPAPGESAYVVITISYRDTTGEYGTPNTTHERHYYVEIHRPDGDPEVILHYGNSPYGMIMNDTTQFPTDTARRAAKNAFVSSGYTFRGAALSVLPRAARDKLQSVTYWREAWVRNRGLFEPESLTGFHPATDTNGDREYRDGAGNPTTPDPNLDPDRRYEDITSVYAPNAGVYSDVDNLDLNDYAFFAILGQEIWEPGVVSAKDSSGRFVDLKSIRAKAMDMDGKTGVTLLDDSATTQVDRFSGNAGTAIIDLGVAGQALTPATSAVTGHPTLGMTQWPVQTTVTTDAGGNETTTYDIVDNIRPGRYIIEYSYYDYDGINILTASRPLVILRKVGDVNADGIRDSIDLPDTGNGHDAGHNDEYAIEDRVTNDPLGYEAGGWDGTKETVYPYANIFKYRVADVNNDRNINNIDANQVAVNVKKDRTALDESNWLRFYDPRDYGHPGSPVS